MKTFGKAADFYRVRVQTLVEDALPELGWEDEIYRRDDDEPFFGNPRTIYVVQVVTLDDQKVFYLKRFHERAKADVFMELVEDDLRELTKNQFEDAHL